MKIRPVNEIPNVGRHVAHDLQRIIRDFVDGDSNIIEIEITEADYKNATVALICMHAAIKRSGKNIKVKKRGNNIYLVKNGF